MRTVLYGILYFSSTHARGADLLQRYERKEEMGQLPEILSDCVADPVKYSPKTCREAEYLHSVGEYLSRYNSTVQRQKLPSITVLGAGENLSYQELFEHYVMKNKPVKGNLESSFSEGSLLGKCESNEECYRNLAFHPITEDVSILKLLQNTSFFTVPKISFNDYLLRVNRASTETVPLLSHWPAAFYISRDAIKFYQCPANMHMVIWSNKINLENVTARVFHQSAASDLGIVQQTDSLHYPHFGSQRKKSWEKTLSFAQFSETILRSHEFLFIPAKFIVSFALLDELGQENAELYRSCFVDASNLNDFKEFLELAGLVSEFESSLLALLQSRNFSINMRRDATDLNLDSLVKQATANSTASFAGDQPIDDPTMPESVRGKKDRNRANRRSSGTSTGGVFKEWQDTMRWNKMITSLTIPKPVVPKVVAVGRTNFTIDWVETFLPENRDKTRFGFNFSICSISGQHSEVSWEMCQSIALERTPEMSTLLKESDIDGEQNLPPRKRAFSATLGGLLPLQSFRFRISIFFDAFNSLPSAWSQVFTTAPLTVPASIPYSEHERGVNLSNSPLCTTLHVIANRPHDDGGSPLLGFYIYFRIVDDADHFLDDWQLSGAYPFEQLKVSISSITKKLNISLILTLFLPHL